MSDSLQTIPEVAKQAGASREQVLTALKRANVAPTNTVKLGQRTMKLYDPMVAAKAVADYLAEADRADAERAAAAIAVREAEAAKPLTLDAITTAIGEMITKSSWERDHTLATIEADVNDTQISIEKLLGIVTKLNDQNVLLFRALKDMDTDHTARLARLQNTLVAMQPSAVVVSGAIVATPLAAPAKPPAPAPLASSIAQAFQATAPKVPAPRPAPAPATQPHRRLSRVVVVGLKGSDRASIEKEFKDCFDLVLVEVGTGDPPRSFEATVRNCDRVVLAFGSSTMTRVKAALRGSGANVVHVNGGMSRLRDTLTSLYVELNEKVPA